VDRFTAMHSFRRVVEARSFSAAARQLGLSAAAVTKHVAWLERELGASLLHRTTRSVTPSEVGTAYHARCVRILDDLEEADAVARADQAEPRGRIRVNAPVSFALVHLGGLVARFRARYPRVQVELSVTDRHINPTAEGIDVVLRITRQLADSELVARRVATMHRVMCAAPGYLARRGTPRSLADLAEHDCAVFAGEARPDLLELETESGPVQQRVDPCFVSGNSLLLRDAVVAGIGIAILPTYAVAADLAAGRLITLLPRFRPVEYGVFALCVRRRDQPARVRAFIEQLAQELASPPAAVATKRTRARRAR
jgi:DNA-binding transcriptional LysR family regulator